MTHERHISKLASRSLPVHSSGLQGIARCSWRSASAFLLQPSDEAGGAADTGSAVHAAVAAFHTNNKDVMKAVEAMHGRRDEYKSADLDDATKMFVAYSQDPRNHEEEVLMVEQKIEFEIAPAPEDPTGEPIFVVGRLDQIRNRNGTLKIDDVKTSKRDPWDVRSESMYQMAAYAVGASIILKKSVHPGALIMPRKYFVRGVDPAAKPPGIFWHYNFDLSHCDAVLNGVRHTVAQIRQGNFWPNGGDYCKWCHFKTIDECIPTLVEVRGLNK